MTPTDAQLAAEFARDVRCGWRPLPLRYWLTGKADR